jgi:hypothetical protein
MTSHHIDLVRTAMTTDERLDDLARVRIWNALAETLAADHESSSQAHEGRRRRTIVLAAGTGLAAAALAAAIAIIVLRPSRSPRPATVAADTTLSLPLGPHTRAAVVGPARFELVGPAAAATTVRVDAGVLLADFSGGPGRSLRIVAPELTVDVVGTLFAVDVRVDETCVSVEHGTVRVTPRDRAAFALTGGRAYCTQSGSQPLAPGMRDALVRHERVIAASRTPPEKGAASPPSSDPVSQPSRAQAPAPAPQPSPAQAPAPAPQPSPAQAPAPAPQPNRAQVVAPAPQPNRAQVIAPAPQPSRAQAPAPALARAPAPAPTRAPAVASVPALAPAAVPGPAGLPARASTPVPAAAAPAAVAVPAAPAAVAVPAAPAAVAVPAAPAAVAVPAAVPVPGAVAAAAGVAVPAPAATAVPAAVPAPATVPAAAAAAPAPPPPSPASRPSLAGPEQLYREAEAALVRDPRAADRVLARLVAQHPQSPLVEQALYDRARIAYQQRSWAAARSHLDQLLALPSSRLGEQARFLACRIAVATQDQGAATCLDSYRRAYPRSPHATDVLGMLVQLDHAAGGCRAAAARITELVQHHPASKLAVAWRARCPSPSAEAP